MTTHAQRIAEQEQHMDADAAFARNQTRQVEHELDLIAQIAALQSALAAAHVRITELEARLRQPFQPGFSGLVGKTLHAYLDREGDDVIVPGGLG